MFQPSSQRVWLTGCTSWVGAHMGVRWRLPTAAVVMSLIPAVSIVNAETGDGRIVAATDNRIVQAWGDLPPIYREQFSRAEFESVRNTSAFECLRVLYSSGGLRVTGFVYKPIHLAPGRRLPAVVYNRGGNRDYGAIDVWDKVIFHRLAMSGFVVLASQYRGADGGEGSDEFGGSDRQDVMSLFPLARSLGYVDMSNVFMLGFSRGGMMTYLAIR